MSMLKMYKEKLLKEPKLLVIIALVLILLIVFTVEPNFKAVSLNIEDKCGKFVNLMSHTIEDENVCKSRCRAQCQSINYAYKKVEFKKKDSGCNTCMCYCR
jgi:hypothetical protein